MDAPVAIPQEADPGQGAGQAPRLIKVTKPAGHGAVVLHLEPGARLDLSEIAAEKITLIRVGNRLIIRFDDGATVIVEPFFGGDGQPIPDVTIQLAPDTAIDATDFASLFPIRDAAALLPDADEPAASGDAPLDPFRLDAFMDRDAADPLSQKLFDPQAGEHHAAGKHPPGTSGLPFGLDHHFYETNPVSGGQAALTFSPATIPAGFEIEEHAYGFVDTIGLDFFSLPGGSGTTTVTTLNLRDTPLVRPDGPGDAAIAESALAGGSGDSHATSSLNIDWGTDQANRMVDGGVGPAGPLAGDRAATFAAGTAAPAGLTASGIDLVYVVGHNGTLLTAYRAVGDTFYDRDGTVTTDKDAARVFTVSLSDAGSGSYAFTLLDALDHGPASARDLAFDFIATDSNGDTATGQFTVRIADDVPIALAGPAAVVEEGPGDPTLANAAPLLTFGGDGPRVGMPLFFLTADVIASVPGLGSVAALSSRGEVIHYAFLDADQTVLVGHTGTTPSAADASNVVFSVTLNRDGSYDFVLRQPIDHFAPVGGEQAVDLAFAYSVFDRDGDAAAGTFTVRIDAAGSVGHYDALASDVFVNLSDASITLVGETVAAHTATDRDIVTRKVIGLDQLGTIADVSGSQGDDILFGGDADNHLSGNDGDDLLVGGKGHDILDGGAGSDLLVLSADVDYDPQPGIGLIFEFDDNLVTTWELTGGSSSNDALIGGAGFDTVLLAPSPDASAFILFRAEASSATFSGIERVVATSGDDIIVVPRGLTPDTGGRVEIEGAAGNDAISGTDHDDLLLGGAGKDLIVAYGGADEIDGGDGDDLLYGGGGNDTIKGGTGADLLYGGSDDDLLIVAGDEDVPEHNILIGTFTFAFPVPPAGRLLVSDTIVGGAGFDTVQLVSSPDSGGTLFLYVDGPRLSGVEQILGSDGDDLIFVQHDLSVDGATALRIDGGAGDDQISGRDGTDEIQGGDGDDLIGGGAGDDVLSGGDGNDKILGADGNDQLWGGSGADRFYFVEFGAANRDVIADYSADDILDLAALLDGRVPGGSAEGFVRAVSDGERDTLVQIDLDGGGDTWQDVALLQGYGPSHDVLVQVEFNRDVQVISVS